MIHRLTIVLALAAAVAAPLGAQQASLLAEARRELAAGRYNEAATVYRRCLEQSPADTVVLGELTTALDAAGRWPEALPYLERLVGMSAPDARRLTKLAQYLAWSGARRRAGDLFARAYAQDSTDILLLAAYGEYLTWTPQTRSRGMVLLRRALAAVPNDGLTRERLANAELQSGHYVQAARLVDGLAPNIRIRSALADSLARATNVTLRIGGRSETRTGQLSSEGIDAGSVLPMGYGRLELDVASLRLSDAAGSFSTVRGAVGYRYLNPTAPQIEMTAGGWTGLDTPHELWEASFVTRTAPAFPSGLSLGVDRAPILETRQSFLGTQSAGVHRGAVRATSVRAGVRLSLGAFEGTVGGASAVIDGENLDRNRRTGGSALAVLALRPHAPWIRAGYEFRTQRYRLNAFDDGTNPRRLGGYFSPHSDDVHFGVLQFAHRLAPRLILEVDARAGRETVQMTSDRPSESRTAAVVHAHTAWRVARSVDLDASYLHVDVFTAFRMRETRVMLRRLF